MQRWPGIKTDLDNIFIKSTFGLPHVPRSENFGMFFAGSFLCTMGRKKMPEFSADKWKQSLGDYWMLLPLTLQKNFEEKPEPSCWDQPEIMVSALNLVKLLKQGKFDQLNAAIDVLEAGEDESNLGRIFAIVSALAHKDLPRASKLRQTISSSRFNPSLLHDLDRKIRQLKHHNDDYTWATVYESPLAGTRRIGNDHLQTKSRAQVVQKTEAESGRSVQRGIQQLQIWSSYLTTKPDPQRQFHWRPNDFSKIAKWYASVEANNCSATIFNDSLSDEFVKKYTTDRIKFITVKDYNWSTNDARFWFYRKNLDLLDEDDFIFLTDISDVELVNYKKVQLLDPTYLFVGRDMSTTPVIADNLWMVKKTLSYLNETQFGRFSAQFFDAPLYNAGVIGGSVAMLKILLDTMLELLALQKSDNNYNMFAFNYSIFSNKDLRVSDAKWLTSGFKQNEKNADVLFKHK